MHKIDRIGYAVCIFFLLLIAAISFTGCKQKEIISKTQEPPIKVNVRLVGIDSLTESRTEDKVLTVTIKN